MSVITRVLFICIFLLSLPAFSAPVDINTADAKLISKNLKGIGLKKAKAIVEYRKTHGPFANADELVKVDGIGKSLVEKNRTDIIISQLRR